MVKETIVAKKVGSAKIGFKIILLFVLKIVLADTGYIEVEYTKIKSALANRSSACVTARNPAVRRQGRARGAVAAHRYDHVGSSPAWILLLRASLLNITSAGPMQSDVLGIVEILCDIITSISLKKNR